MDSLTVAAARTCVKPRLDTPGAAWDHRAVIFPHRLARAAALAALFGAGCGRPDSLNILLVTLDTTRADHLRCYGNPLVETPHLDRLAREGILFEWGLAHAPLTLPSHCSMMTGLTPMAHGVRNNSTQKLGDEAVTLAETLAERGYDTAAVVGAYVLHPVFGLGQGFAAYDADFAGGKAENDFHFVERSAEQVTDAALRWLDGRRSERPFLLWVHYYDPHMDHSPPSPFRERYAQNGYDGEIAYVDWQLGRLLESLDQRKELERTLVWVVADHGESLGEHGELSHGFYLYDSVLRVPYIVSHPESRREDPPPRWKPRRIEAPAECIDIYPTLAALTGEPPSHPVEGRSLLPLLDGRSEPARASYGETMAPLLVQGWAPLRSVRLNQSKYIRAPVPELYDCAADPRELRNLAAERPAETASMARELERLVQRAASAAVAAGEAGISEAERQKLASLGYLQTDAAPPSAAELDPLELTRPDPKTLVPAASRFLYPGLDAFARDDVERALELFRAYVAVDSASGEGHFYLALALRKLGRLDQALAELRLAQRLNPGSYKAALHYGMTLGFAGRLEESRRSLEQARTLNPLSGEPLVLLADLEAREGRPDAALALYEQALALDPGNSAFHVVRGVQLVKMGREEEGLAEFRRSVELTQRSSGPMQRIAQAIAENGHPEIAQALYEDLTRLEPGDPAHLANLGNCHLLAGEFERAAEAYRRAAELSPETPAYHYLLGCAYASASQFPLARTCFLRALEIEPAHVEARRNLQLLERGTRPAVAPQFQNTPEPVGAAPAG